MSENDTKIDKEPIINTLPIKKRVGRPPGKEDNKTKMLRVLKKIWTTSSNRPTDIINAADEYATLMGWKVHKVESSDDGSIVGIEFEKHKIKPIIKSVQEPPINKIIDIPPVIKIDPVIITTTTTTPVNKNLINIEVEVNSEPSPLNLDDL